MARTYILTKDRFEHKAGTTVYTFSNYAYGLIADDQEATGLPHVAVTLDPNGDYPFFTVPHRDLEEVR